MNPYDGKQARRTARRFQIDFENARQPIAPMLPTAIDRDSARPVGSSIERLHQLREQAEGATPTFLQCMSLLLARRRSADMRPQCLLTGELRT